MLLTRYNTDKYETRENILACIKCFHPYYRHPSVKAFISQVPFAIVQQLHVMYDLGNIVNAQLISYNLVQVRSIFSKPHFHRTSIVMYIITNPQHYGNNRFVTFSHKQIKGNSIFLSAACSRKNDQLAPQIHLIDHITHQMIDTEHHHSMCGSLVIPSCHLGDKQQDMYLEYLVMRHIVFNCSHIGAHSPCVLCYLSLYPYCNVYTSHSAIVYHACIGINCYSKCIICYFSSYVWNCN